MPVGPRNTAALAHQRRRRERARELLQKEEVERLKELERRSRAAVAATDRDRALRRSVPPRAGLFGERQVPLSPNTRLLFDDGARVPGGARSAARSAVLEKFGPRVSTEAKRTNRNVVDVLRRKSDPGDLSEVLAETARRSGGPGVAEISDLIAQLDREDPKKAQTLVRQVARRLGHGPASLGADPDAVSRDDALAAFDLQVQGHAGIDRLIGSAGSDRLGDRAAGSRGQSGTGSLLADESSEDGDEVQVSSDNRDDKFGPVIHPNPECEIITRHLLKWRRIVAEQDRKLVKLNTEMDDLTSEENKLTRKFKDSSVPIRLSPTPTICSVHPFS